MYKRQAGAAPGGLGERELDHRVGGPLGVEAEDHGPVPGVRPVLVGSLFRPDQDHWQFGTRHDGQPDGADEEAADTAQSTGAEDQEFGVLRGTHQRVRGRTAHLLHGHVHARVAPAQALARLTRNPLAPLLLRLRTDERGLGQRVRGGHPDMDDLQRQTAQFRLAGRPFGGGTALG